MNNKLLYKWRASKEILEAYFKGLLRLDTL